MSTRALKHAALIICICVLLSLLPATRARGDDPLIFNVDTTDDVKDFAINSVCSVDAPTGGPCTLRAAIAEAEGNILYTDVIINLPAGNYLLTIPPDGTNDVNSGDLNIVPASCLRLYHHHQRHRHAALGDRCQPARPGVRFWLGAHHPEQCRHPGRLPGSNRRPGLSVAGSAATPT